MKWFRRGFGFLEERRAVHIARELRVYLEPGESVLDFGCGSLIVAEQVQKKSRVRIVGLDTIDYRKRQLPMVLFSGRAAPFKDKSFDAVLIAFILHHCDDGGNSVLCEARRLARKKILLLEDSYDTAVERVITRVVDGFLNRLEDPRILLPYRFRSSKEWKALFTEFKMSLVATVRVRTTPILSTRQILFVLKP